MGIQDRGYWREDGGYDEVGRIESVSFGLPRPGRAVGTLLIINFAVFIVQLFLDRPSPRYPVGPMGAWLGVTVWGFWQVWRYLTFQFLHAGALHILLNMFGLYMLGSPLEQRWGTSQFVRFYLVCGAVAGLAYVIIGASAGLPGDLPIVGASGGVYAVLLACAVFFPGFRIVFILFLVPIRIAAAVIFAGMVLLVLGTFARGNVDAAMSDVAHLGGAAAAAVWIWGLPRLRGAGSGLRERLQRGAWQRKIKRQADQQARIDHVLTKIHEHGVESLSRKERKILQEATHAQREEDRRISRL